MKTDEPYDRWLASKQALDVPEGWGDSVMQRIDRYEATKRASRLHGQTWVDWFCACLPARVGLVLAGMAVCVTRFVVLLLAVLG